MLSLNPEQSSEEFFPSFFYLAFALHEESFKFLELSQDLLNRSAPIFAKLEDKEPQAIRPFRLTPVLFLFRVFLFFFFHRVLKRHSPLFFSSFFPYNCFLPFLFLYLFVSLLMPGSLVQITQSALDLMACLFMLSFLPARL